MTQYVPCLSKNCLVLSPLSRRLCGGGPSRLTIRAICGGADFCRPPVLSVNKFSPSTAVHIFKTRSLSVEECVIVAVKGAAHRQPQGPDINLFIPRQPQNYLRGPVKIRHNLFGVGLLPEASLAQVDQLRVANLCI